MTMQNDKRTEYRYRSGRLEETALLAEHLVPLFRPGTVIALDGDLGAGKTAFSQAIARAMGVREIVNSPTFTIIKEYDGDLFRLYHMDVYRLSAEEADELGLDDYFYGQGVTLVEWASIVEDLLPQERLNLYIERHGETSRVFRIKPYGATYSQWCERLKENLPLL